MAEFFRMLMADAQQAQKASGPHEEHMMDSFPRYREADNVLKYTVRVALRGVKPPTTATLSPLPSFSSASYSAAGQPSLPVRPIDSRARCVLRQIPAV